MTVNDVPWVAIQGRKGGSTTLVVAAIHAMLGLAEAEQRRWFGKARSEDSSSKAKRLKFRKNPQSDTKQYASQR